MKRTRRHVVCQDAQDASHLPNSTKCIAASLMLQQGLITVSRNTKSRLACMRGTRLVLKKSPLPPTDGQFRMGSRHPPHIHSRGGHLLREWSGGICLHRTSPLQKRARIRSLKALRQMGCASPNLIPSCPAHRLQGRAPVMLLSNTVCP